MAPIQLVPINARVTLVGVLPDIPWLKAFAPKTVMLTHVPEIPAVHTQTAFENVLDTIAFATRIISQLMALMIVNIKIRAMA